MEASPDPYERLLKAHLDMNPKSWAALQERGVDETTPMQLDFQYTTPGEDEVHALMRHLRSETDYELRGGARDVKEGARRWLVLGTTSPMTLSPERLDAWVTRMTAYGREHGAAKFDGWGARTPESAPGSPRAAGGGLWGLLSRRRRRR